MQWVNEFLSRGSWHETGLAQCTHSLLVQVTEGCSGARALSSAPAAWLDYTKLIGLHVSICSLRMVSQSGFRSVQSQTCNLRFTGSHKKTNHKLKRLEEFIKVLSEISQPQKTNHKVSNVPRVYSPASSHCTASASWVRHWGPPTLTSWWLWESCLISPNHSFLIYKKKWKKSLTP